MRRAALILAVAATGCDAAPETTKTCGYPVLDRTVLVVERGTETSALARLRGGCFEEWPADLALGTDQNLFTAGGHAYVGINDSGLLRQIDPETLEFGATVDAYQDHPTPVRPHGIYGVAADDQGSLWISRDDVGSLAVAKPGGAFATVDLSGLDPDGIPDMNGLAVHAGKAFVALGFLPAWNAKPDAGVEAFGDHAKRAGALAVLDVATRTVTGTIDLVGHNPVRALVPASADGGVVLVATPGKHDAKAPEDGIDRVWLDGSQATEQLIDEPTLGGSVDEVVWGSDTEIYAIVLGPESGLNPTRLVRIDVSQPAGARVTDLLRAPWFTDPVNGAAYVFSGLALTKGHVLVGDHTPGQAGIHVFSRDTQAEVAFVPALGGAPQGLVSLPP
jgi:hypothetical protein